MLLLGHALISCVRAEQLQRCGRRPRRELQLLGRRRHSGVGGQAQRRHPCTHPPAGNAALRQTGDRVTQNPVTRSRCFSECPPSVTSGCKSIIVNLPHLYLSEQALAAMMPSHGCAHRRSPAAGLARRRPSARTAPRRPAATAWRRRAPPVRPHGRAPPRERLHRALRGRGGP